MNRSARDTCLWFVLAAYVAVVCVSSAMHVQHELAHVRSAREVDAHVAALCRNDKRVFAKFTQDCEHLVADADEWHFTRALRRTLPKLTLCPPLGCSATLRALIGDLGSIGLYAVAIGGVSLLLLYVFAVLRRALPLAERRQNADNAHRLNRGPEHRMIQWQPDGEPDHLDLQRVQRLRRVD